MSRSHFILVLVLTVLLVQSIQFGAWSFSLQEEAVQGEEAEELFDSNLQYGEGDGSPKDLASEYNDVPHSEEAEWWDEYAADDGFSSAGFDLDGEERKLVDELLDWVAKEGVEGRSRLEVVGIHTAGANGSALGRSQLGLRAAEELPEGQEVLRIPRSLWVSEGHVANEVMPYPGAEGAVVVAGWLLRERARGAGSLWWTFLRLLPSRVPLPYFWSNAELQELDHEPLVAQVDEMRVEWGQQYQRCSQSALGGASLAEFEWAMAVVASRCLPLPSGCFLLPLADLLNHGADRLLRVEASDDAISLLADGPIPEGSALLRSYGRLHNAGLLLRYGFVPDYNTHDSVALFDDVPQLAQYYAAVYGQVGGELAEGAGRSPARTTVRKGQHGSAPGFTAQAAVKVALAAAEAAGTYVAAGHSPAFERGAVEGGAMLGVWEGARVEPRLIAALVAMCHAQDLEQGAEALDLKEVAQASALLGSDQEDATCQAVEAGAAPMLGPAVRCAAQVLVDLIGESLQAFRTSFEDDLELLGNALDPDSDFVLAPEEQTRVEFRTSRKRLLVDALERLEEVCDLGRAPLEEESHQPDDEDAAEPSDPGENEYE